MSRFFSAILFPSLLTVGILQVMFAQGEIEASELTRATLLLTGEAALDIETREVTGPDPQPKMTFMVLYNEKFLFVKHVEGDSLAPPVDYLFSAPFETRIVSARFKSDDPSKILILLSNKSTVVVSISYNSLKGEFVFTPVTRDPFAPMSNLTKILGDALYILANGKIYVSRDTAKTWAIDSTNIGHLYVQDISMDSNQYAWIATYDGIFYQHPDSNVWRKVSLLPGTFQTSYAIFVDRKNRIFVTKPGAVFVSTDRGSSWTDISDGLSGNITRYGDDAFGNIYGTHLSASYRLKNLTPPWEKISDSIAALSLIPSNNNPINSVRGDSVIYATTKFGLFHSTDQGTTWKRSPNSAQLPANIFYSGAVRAGNYYFLSSNLGVFRFASGGTAWEKVFPTQGYISGVNAVTSDSAGIVYGNFPFKTGPSTSTFIIVTSTDHGTTWNPDTAGLGALGVNAGTQAFDYFVDREGMQYLGGNGRLYSKRPGQSWTLDTAGIGMKPGEFIADVSLNNKKGFIYLCRRVGGFPTYTLALYRRAIGDSVWQTVNTTALSTTEGRMVSDADGNIVVRTLSAPYKIWRFDGTTWSEILLPTGIGSSPFALRIAVDRSGVLWGVFVGSGVNKGVHFTTNNGTTWKYVGLEKVGITQLTTIGDTAYVATFIDGLHGFTTASEPTSVEKNDPRIAASYELFQNYPNPFNPTTTISFTVPVSGFASLKVYDILGREVAVLLNEVTKPGMYSMRFDASRLSSGIYIYSLRAGNSTVSKKLMLMK